MLYYKIDKQHRYLDKKYQWHEFIENELVTEKEFTRIIGKSPKDCPLFNKYSHIVNIPKSSVYFSFGVRFELR